MKIQSIIKLPLIALLLLSSFLVTQPVMAQPGVNVPIESFYDDLAPYGQWMNHPNYGDVWLPNVGADFQPYATGGRWMMTEYGNTWVSDYSWGWAPFHYGRWIFDPAYGGWLWIPGNEWGPAWVSWRSGGGYYGWAPLGPGMGINININLPASYWTFVPQMYFSSPRWYNYCVPRPNIGNVYYGTTIINNYYRSNNRMYAYGPPRADIERYTRQPVPVYRVDRMDRPGRSVVGNGSVGFYQPGRSMAYGRTYDNSGRNDRSYRSDYNNNNPAYSNGPSNRDNRYDMPSRGYNTPAPSRTYDGNNSGRDGFQNNIPSQRNYDNPSMNRDVPNRFESSRGSYSPGQSQRSTMESSGNAQPNRSFERAERPSQMNTPSMSGGGRSEGRIQQMPQGQGQQRSMESSQRNGGDFGRGGRGPR